MEGIPGRGEVIFLRFPHTDLTHAKSRPAVVLAALPQNDMLVCQVTSQDRSDPYAITLDGASFERGGLPRTSYARAGRLFTANASVVTRRVGRIRENVLAAIVDRLVALVRGA